MTLPIPVYSVSKFDITLADDLLLKYRGQDRRRAGILSVLEEDWRCSRLVLARVLSLVSKIPGGDTGAFLQILEHGLEQYERTITHDISSGLSFLRYPDGFRYAVFVEAVISKTHQVLTENQTFQPQWFANACAAEGEGIGREKSRRALYDYFVPDGMQQYFGDLSFEDGIVGNRLDFSHGSPAGVDAGPKPVD